MELDDLVELIQELTHLVGEADIAADAGNVDEAREKLTEAKELLGVSCISE